MSNKTLIVAAAFLTSLLIVSTGSIPITTTTITQAQTGSMATLQNIVATYAISIVPGAAQRDSPFHYFPPAIAIPTGTTVAWFNNDPGSY